MPDPPPTIVAEHLGVTFADVVALDDLSLTVGAGSSVALIGPNGSGKTTLLHLIAGLHRPTSGSLALDPSVGTVAYVLQRRDEHSWMPLIVDEVLRMGRYRHRGLLGRFRPSDRAAIDAAARRLEIEDLRRRQFGELSGGQRQRVMVAQALVQEPRLLLLDEPITGLDLASQHRILELVDELTGDGVTVVLSTHHLDEARRCDTVLLLNTSAEAYGPPSDVLTAEHLAAAFAGRTLAVTGPEGHEVVVLDDHEHGHGDP